jgi:ATP-dependent 26S proteasome regulatory subunit
MLADSREYLRQELGRLDLLLHRQILRLRASYQLSLDEFRGLYISDQQVDDLLTKLSNEDNQIPNPDSLTYKAEDLHRLHVAELRDHSTWKQLGNEFRLSPFEQDVLLLAIAPEMDLKYETIFAYLNNDITRKLPTFDLALRVFACDAQARLDLRKYLLRDATLFRDSLLRTNTQERATWLATSFSVTPAVSEFLLGVEPARDCKPPTTIWEEVPVSASLRGDLEKVVKLFSSNRSEQTPLIVFEGHPSSGKRLAAEAICQSLGLALTSLDLAAPGSGIEQLQRELQQVLLHRRLRHSALYLHNIEALFNKEGNALPDASAIFRRFSESSIPVFVTCLPLTPWRPLLRDQKTLTFEFPDLQFNDRLIWWRTCAQGLGCSVDTPTAELLAARFVLSGGQIKNAVTSAVDLNEFQEAESRTLSADDLMAAARAQSDQTLGTLSLRVKTIYTWEDLVLPKTTLKQVKEIAASIRYRHIVYSDWGFDKRIAYGKGLKVCFAGPSGTGKTMTAGVIARDLGFDLYKIDLSSVVSKYIGETEKALDRIFRAAHASNAILFFDEADALFGKRSEVKDAHDRYANIEVAYLLTKLEEHEGAVILATNLGKNIDDAFSRRMHYTVEFPLPGEPHREQLWRGMFPPEAPLSPDVDFGFLAKQFQISGGDIKNVVLAAAFLAAQDGKVVTMKQIVSALARQMSKRGRIPSATDFKQYHALID